ncbi:MAG: DNA-binding protein, partial [Leptospirales bacterium]
MTLSRGERPTIWNVRELLGQGSQTPLARFLNQWKEARTAQTPDPEISPELCRALTEEMRKPEALARVGPEADLASLRLEGVPEQRQEIERLRVSLIESEKERAVLTERLGERKSPKT